MESGLTVGGHIGNLDHMVEPERENAQSHVSVIIPAWGSYSGEPLNRAVQSALQASASPVVVIVVDNASSPPVSIPDVNLVRTEQRLSLGGARNLGLSHSTTDYVLFLDADDVLLPGSIDEMLSTIPDVAQGGPRPVLVCASLVDPTNGVAYHWPYAWMRRATTWPRLFQLLETFRPSFPVNGSLIPRSAAARTLGYDNNPESAEDWTFGVSLSWLCRAIPSDRPTMAYAPSVGGVWSKNDKFKKHLAHRRCVRLRIMKDPSIPRWAVLLLPLLAVGHSIDVFRKLIMGFLRSVGKSRS